MSEIRKSLETVLDKVYEESEEQELEKDFLKIIEQSNLLCQVKNEWKDSGILMDGQGHMMRM